MSSHDFLHIHARTELSEDYAVAGFVFRLTTNHGALLECFRGTFPTTKNAGHVDFFFRFWIDDGDASRPPWPQPYVRGLVHRVYAGFDAKSSVFADLRARTMMGRFSPAMAEDAVHWKTIIFPVLMSIVSGSAGMVELHASCAAIDHRGIILLGPSRSGKSTLAMALLQSGLRLLSYDRIFCLLQNRDLAAFGLPVRSNYGAKQRNGLRISAAKIRLWVRTVSGWFIGTRIAGTVSAVQQHAGPMHYCSWSNSRTPPFA